MNDDDQMPDCMCDFDNGCNGLGMLQCRGCGGDLCVCICGGEYPCGGCEQCDHGDTYDDDDHHNPE